MNTPLRTLFFTQNPPFFSKFKKILRPEKCWTSLTILLYNIDNQQFKGNIANFEVIINFKLWFLRRIFAPYFYIIKRGIKKEAEERWWDPEILKRTPIRFEEFFIWQAIVRGRLFLQWTFFFFRHLSSTSPPLIQYFFS